MFNQGIRFGKVLVHGHLNLVTRKRGLPGCPSFTQPCQQGFKIGNRFRNRNILFILTGHFCQMNKIRQLDGNLAIGICSLALASLQIVIFYSLQIRFPILIIVFTRFVQGAPGLATGVAIIKVQFQ